MHGHELRIGTRGSSLALWQANLVGSLLGVPFTTCVIKTSGDVMPDVPLQGQSTMGFFTREIETELIEGRIDLAVHSLKDLPVEQPEGLVLAAILERHAPGDMLLVRVDALDETMPVPVARGARVGAGSLRRQSALASLRPDLVCALVRGNVPSRLRKTQEGQVDAIVLARAGLERLGIDPSPLLAFYLDPGRFIPAPGQGAVAVEVRGDDAEVRDLVARLDHAATRRSVELERRLLALAGGGCHAPFAAWVRPTDGERVRASVGAAAKDGSWRHLHLSGRDEEVEVRAQAWFEQGCPGSGESVAQEGICRPAPPSC